MRSLPLAVPRPGLTEDLDLTPDGAVVAAVRAGDALRIVTPDWQRESPAPIQSPRIRVLDPDRVLLVGSRTPDHASNAWILNRQRGVVAHFLVGDGIENIVVRSPFIIVTYFDEGVLRYGAPGSEGVAFFDFDGRFLWGYRTQFGDAAVDVMDVYAASTDEAGYLWFYPYTGFPLVRVDIEAREQRIFTPPEVVEGSNALSIMGNTAYFLGPYQRHGVLFEWPLGSSEARRMAMVGGDGRGLPGGRFITRREGKWSVLEDLGSAPA